MKKGEQDYIHGYKSGKRYVPNNALHLENDEKAKRALADPNTPEQVKRYWRGYLDGKEARELFNALDKAIGEYNATIKR